jgi:uncharacterized protein
MRRIMRLLLKWRIIILLSFMSEGELDAQNFIAGKTFVKDYKVFIRWVPSNNYVLNKVSKDGVVIKRLEYVGETLPDSSMFKNAVVVGITKSIDEKDKAWVSKINEKIENGFLYNVLYKPNAKNVKNTGYFYGLAMLACDQDTAVAKNAGLFFIDNNVGNMKYAYFIQPTNVAAKKQILPAIILANSAEDTFLPMPDSLRAKVYKREIRLVWPEEKHKSYYTGYFIERSEDGVHFTRINRKPHVQIKTKDDKTKTDITYYDTTGKYNINYFYRIQGLSFFGPVGPYSNIFETKIIKPIGIICSLDSTKLVSDTLHRIFWHNVGTIPSDEYAGAHVFKCDVENGIYKKISSQLIKNDNSFIDEKPFNRSYYKVIAYNIFGDSSVSFSAMAMLPDIKPPNVPTNLRGIIDSNGVVILNWTRNKESDLKGYRVFKNNSVKEEPVEITKNLLMDTTFSDKVDLNTLTENAVYYITAVDEVYNNSAYTAPLILKRPDKVKPVPVVFTKISGSDKGINLSWVNSSSSDVETYELLRIEKNDAVTLIKEWQVADTLENYLDTNLIVGNYYKYTIRVIDKAGNFSVQVSHSYFYNVQLRKEIAGFQFKIDKENKSVFLEWKPVDDVFSYILYKAKSGGDFISFKTFKNSTVKFEDKEVNIGNVYRYAIKAQLNDGAQTTLSKEIKAEF